MEMADKQFSHLWNSLCNCVLQLVQLRLTAYGNGCTSSSPYLWNCLCNRVLRLVQLCLTACITASYGLWKWLHKQFSLFMELLVQLCLTACATVFYRLCNCVLRLMEMVSKQFPPFMETVLEVVRAKISGYIKS